MDNKRNFLIHFSTQYTIPLIALAVSKFNSSIAFAFLQRFFDENSQLTHRGKSQFLKKERHIL